MTGGTSRARRAQLVASLLAAALIVAVTIGRVGARLPAIQERSPELHEAERDAQRDRDRAARDAERARDDADGRDAD